MGTEISHKYPKSGLSLNHDFFQSHSKPANHIIPATNFQAANWSNNCDTRQQTKIR